MMKSLSVAASNIRELRASFEKMEQDDFQPTVAISFSDPDFDIQGAVELFKEKGVRLIGCSTAGEIHDDQVMEKSLSVLFLKMPEDAFEVVHLPGEGNDYTSIAAELGKFARGRFENPAIIVYAGGVGVDGESVVTGIKREVGKEIPIYGGLGGDNFRQEKVLTYTHEGVRENGISALVLDNDKIQVRGRAYSGWNDLGKVHTVTKAEGNVLLEVDDKAALDLFNKYFKGIEYKRQPGMEGIFTIPGIYALKIRRQGGVEFLRSTLIFDFERKALILAGGVREGDEFKFCPTPDFSVVDATIDEFQNIANDLGEVDAIIMTSCAARQIAFGPMFEDEVEGIYEIWKKPMVGYMAYGEIGNTGKEQICEFHNVTCSLTTLTVV